MSSSPTVRPSSDAGRGEQRALGDRALAGRVEQRTGRCVTPVSPTSRVTGLLPTGRPLAQPPMMAENSPAPPPACTSSRPSGRNFGSVASAERTPARLRRCRRRRARARCRGAAGGRAARRAMRSRSQPASANTRPCSGPTTRMASNPISSFGWCTVRRQAAKVLASYSGVARQLVDDAAWALAGEQRDGVDAGGDAAADGERANGDAASSSAKQNRTCPGCRAWRGRPRPGGRRRRCGRRAAAARPIVELARLPWPSTLTPQFMPIARVPGPLQTITGPTGIVVASTPCMLNSSVHAASTAASTHGRYSGRQPAITALIATFSTVTSTRSGGDLATTSSGRAVVPSQHPQHPLLGRRDDGQAVGPAAVEQRLDLVLELGELDRGASAGPPPPKRARSSSTRSGSTLSEPQPGRITGRSAPSVGDAGERLPVDRATNRRCARPRRRRRRGCSVGTVSMSWCQLTARSASWIGRRIAGERRVVLRVDA